jgi:hypothetical protein
MKLTVAVLAALVTLMLAGPAHADIWDFSWLSTAQLGPRPGQTEQVNRQATGTTTATITSDPNGIQIHFPSPAGTANVFVSREPATSLPGHEAIGGVPMFFSPEGTLSIFPGSAIGTYSFTGSLANPDTFSLALGSGGSGPAGVQRFSGSGTRQVATASEPMMLLLVSGALWGTALALRQRA